MNSAAPALPPEIEPGALYAKAQEPKELFRIEGGRHFDVCDRPAYVAQALAKVDAFLKHHRPPGQRPASCLCPYSADRRVTGSACAC